MAGNGVKTSDFVKAGVLDEVIGNKDGTTQLVSFADMIVQVLSQVGPTYNSQADLFLDVDWPAGSIAAVFGEVSDAKNGVYKKVGAFGASPWVRLGDLPLNHVTQNLLVKKADSVELQAEIDALMNALASEKEARIAGDLSLVSADHFAGAWDASAGSFPTQRFGGGAVRNGDHFKVAVGGTVDGEEFEEGSMLHALIDAPSSTAYSGQWFNFDIAPLIVPIQEVIDNFPVPVQGFSDLATLTPQQVTIGGLVLVSGLGALFKRVASGGHLDYSASGGILLEVLPDNTGKLNVAAFGAAMAPVNSQGSFESWAAAISTGGYKGGVVPPGVYLLDGNIGFAGQGKSITALGCLFQTLHNDGATFDLNADALPDESAITFSVYWEGGEFFHQGGNPTGSLQVSNINGTFATCEKVTGQSSGHSAWICSYSGGSIVIADHSGEMSVGETVLGELSQATATVAAFAGGNTASAIRARGITRGSISKVFAKQYGRAAFELAPRESFNLVECDGFENARHAYVPDFISTNVANPQVVGLIRPGFSKHYLASIHAEGPANAFKVRDGFTIGTNAIVIKSRAAGKNGQEVSVAGTTFEQPVNGEYYIRVTDGGAGKLQNLGINGCGFGAVEGGDGCLIADLSRVDGFTFSENYAPSVADGWLHFDVNCTNIDIGRNQIITAARISYDCDRKEIDMWPYQIPLDNDRARIDNKATFSGGNGSKINETVVVADLNLSKKVKDLLAIMPIKGCTCLATAEDTQSSGASNIWYQFVTDTSVNDTAGYLHASARLDNYNNNSWATVSAYVEADSEGNIAKQVRSSESGTLTGHGRITALHF